jgi:hypothetical protein
VGPDRTYPPRLREELANEEARHLTKQSRRRFSVFLLIGLALSGLVGFLLVGLLSRISGEGSTGEGVSEFELPADVHLQVDVLNACGVPGVAEVVSAFLREAGFDIPSYGNAAYPESFSMIFDRVGDSLSALRVARALDIPAERIVRRIDSSRFVKATVVIGRDYRSLNPFDKADRKPAR